MQEPGGICNVLRIYAVDKPESLAELNTLACRVTPHPTPQTTPHTPHTTHAINLVVLLYS